MKVLVTGAGGMLGREVVREFLRRDAAVVALTKSEADVSDLKAIRAACRIHAPDVIMNCAAYTNVDAAERERELAFATNALGARNVAIAAQDNGASLVHISTDYVFDGTKESSYTILDTPSPINVYGESKLLGERYVTWVSQRWYVVRSSWLFGLGGRNFVESIIAQCSTQAELTVVSDQFGFPTYARSLSEALADLVATGAYGLYHITNQGRTSWYEFAKGIISALGLRVVVHPVSSDAFPRPAKRPLNSTLDPYPLRETIGRLLPQWQEALNHYLTHRKRDGARK